MQLIIQAFLNAHRQLLNQQFSELDFQDLAKNLGRKCIEFNFKTQKYYFQLNDQGAKPFFEQLPTSDLIEINTQDHDDDATYLDEKANANPHLTHSAVYQPALKITFTPPQNNSLSYSGEDAWMNWLKIEGDIATAKHLQNHVKQLKLEQSEILNAFLQPVLTPALGDKALLVSEKIQQHLQQFLNISLDLKNNTLHFLTQERPILATKDALNEQQSLLYHLNNDVDRLAQKIDYLNQIIAAQKI